jgi:Protein of unknown function (DUF4239)
MVFEWLYGLDILVFCPVTIILVAGSAELGNWIGLRFRQANSANTDFNTVVAAVLGLLALLIAFSFSMAEARYDKRRDLVLEEANAISSTANFALMLPEPAQEPILKLLRDYAAVRVALGVGSDPSKMEQDIARSLDLQVRLWRQAEVLTAANPQSLAAYRFVGSLDEMNNIHERRVTALRNRVPVAVMCMLVGMAMVAMAFTGYNEGVIGVRRRLINLILSITVTLLIMLIVDLDRPYRGSIQVSVQALVDAAQGIPQ